MGYSKDKIASIMKIVDMVRDLADDNDYRDVYVMHILIISRFLTSTKVANHDGTFRKMNDDDLDNMLDTMVEDIRRAYHNYNATVN